MNNLFVIGPPVVVAYYALPSFMRHQARLLFTSYFNLVLESSKSVVISLILFACLRLAQGNEGFQKGFELE